MTKNIKTLDLTQITQINVINNQAIHLFFDDSDIYLSFKDGFVMMDRKPGKQKEMADAVDKFFADKAE